MSIFRCGKLRWFWRLFVNWRISWLILLILAAVLIFHQTRYTDDIVLNSAARKILNTWTLSNKNNLTSGVKKDLFHGVKEDENTAREIDEDGEKEELKKDKKDANGEDNAAREVHSNEIDINAIDKKKASKKDEENNLEEQEESFHQMPPQQQDNFKEESNSSNGINNWRNLSKSEIDELSILGRRLFLNENIGKKQDRNFTILAWKYGLSLERRLIRNYGKVKKDPFRHCSVRNCIITYKDEDFDKADAVLFHLHRVKGPPTEIKRNRTDQRWVWMADESPYNTFMVAKDRNFDHYNGFFNWSMNYRLEADVPVPYGRTVPLNKNEVNTFDYKSIYDSKNKTVAILGSNCGGKNGRWKYVKHFLVNYMPVDMYGGCGTLKCKGHFQRDCPALNDYLFYLAFENSNCKDYITEKVRNMGDLPIFNLMACFIPKLIQHIYH